MFIKVNTGANIVVNAVKVIMILQNTGEVTLERRLLNVEFVASDLHKLEVFLCTAEIVVHRKHTNVTYVERHLVSWKV